jgi:hypothetical protein
MRHQLMQEKAGLKASSVHEDERFVLAVTVALKFLFLT